MELIKPEQAEALHENNRADVRLTTQSRPRDASFDFLKGGLVLVMVGHHSLGYFMGRDYPLIKYLDFVTGGFVFASGFLASFLISSRISSSDGKASLKLLQRGGKLLVLFVLLNAMIGLVLTRGSNGKPFGLERFFGNLDSVFLAGTKSLAAFAILVPIAYTLVCLALLVLMPQRAWVSLIVAFVLLTFCTLESDVPFNIYFLSVGIAGVALGMHTDPLLLSLAKAKRTRLLFLSGAAVYMISISVLKSDTGFIYATGIFFVLGTFYFFADVLDSNSWFFQHFVSLGRYSLFAYLAQILFLQVLHHFGPRSLLARWNAIIPILLTIAFLVILCYGVELLRRRNDRINGFYRTVFC